MRLLLLGTMLFSGGTAVAMQNETVNEEVNQAYNRVRVVIQNRFKNRMVDRVKEDGFPYPPQDFLDTLTDEQEALITTTIDQINLEYDWANMTDEEIIAALKDVHAEMEALYEDLGLELPTLRERIAQRLRQRFAEHVGEDGLPYPPQAYLDNLTEEQALAITTAIDEYNATYDWANMTDEEVREALLTIKDEMAALYDELGLEQPQLGDIVRHRIRGRMHDRFHQDPVDEDVPEDDVPEDDSDIPTV